MTKKQNKICPIDCLSTVCEHNNPQPKLSPDVEKRFDETFIRDDGLMDKYSYDKDGEVETTGNVIKEFFAQEIEKAKGESYKQGITEARNYPSSHGNTPIEKETRQKALQEMEDWAKEERGNTISACMTGADKEKIAEVRGYVLALKVFLSHLSQLKKK